ncbi:MAG: hypothetical protein COW42_12020, partial [Deltaproteobacteria bacterium CG17_big_fil_post_rev_8_21_14_2_50_63_7]
MAYGTLTSLEKLSLVVTLTLALPLGWSCSSDSLKSGAVETDADNEAVSIDLGPDGDYLADTVDWDDGAVLRDVDVQSTDIAVPETVGDVVSGDIVAPYEVDVNEDPMSATSFLGVADFVVADVDGDGFEDVVALTATSELVVYLYDPTDPSLMAFREVSSVPSPQGTLKSGDFDGDGLADVAVLDLGDA